MGKTVKTLPYDESLEAAVLGAILNDKDAIIKVIKDFRPDVFYVEKNRLVAESILRLHNQARKIDILTVSNDLKTAGKLDIVGGAFYLTELSDRVVSSYHIEDHLSKVRELHFAREQISLYSEKIEECYSFQDPYNVAIEVSNKLVLMQKDSDSENEYTMQDLATMSLREIESRGSQKLDIVGYSTGIGELDRITLGFQAPDLTIIAGRPAMGKTVVALTITEAISNSTPVAFFSLEMSASQLYRRLLARETSINGKKIKTNDLTFKEREFLSIGNQNLAKKKIVFNDTPALNIDKLGSLIAIYKHRYKIGAVVIDYLQLLKGNTKGHGNSTAELTEISNKLKRYAKQFDIPIIALSQLSRAVENRPSTGYKPVLSDLRESGSIEQDADNVWFLWRPEYYDIQDKIPFRDYGTLDSKDLLVFIIAKCRDGEIKSVPCLIDLKTSKLSDHPDVELIRSVGEQAEMPF